MSPRTFSCIRILGILLSLSSAPETTNAVELGHAQGSGSGDGSSAFTGLAQAPEANLFVGAATTSIPIDLPPGRKNMTPKLALTYNSSGGLSIYGVGWDLPLGKVQRSRKHGLINRSAFSTTQAGDYYASEMVVSLPGGTVQCRIGSQNECIPQTDEAFLLIQVDKGANRWLVRDRSGTRYYFGLRSTARVPFVLDFDHTSVWALNEIQDLHGNTIEIEYEIQDDVLYPKTVTYGGWKSHHGTHEAASGVFQVEFEWLTQATASGLPATVQIANALATGTPATIRRMLSKIVIKNKLTQTTIRSYKLNYDFQDDPRQGRQGFLTAVTLMGKGDVVLTRADGVPASSTFSYQENEDSVVGSRFGFAATSGSPWLVGPLVGIDDDYGRRSHGNDPNDTSREIMDLNGDSFPDLIDAEECDSETNPYWRVFLGSKNGFSATSTLWEIADYCDIRRVTVSGENIFTKYDTFDFTGDAVPDFVDSNYSSTWKVYRGRANGATVGIIGGFDSEAIEVLSPISHLRRTISQSSGFFVWDVVDLVDVNGDGLSDLVYSGEYHVDWDDNALIGRPWTVWLRAPSGPGFLNGMSYPAYFPYIRQTIEGDLWVSLFDMNGDGLPDQVSSGGVGINYGGGFAATTGWGFQNQCGETFLMVKDGNKVIRDIFDINGDGLPDLVTACNNEMSWRVQLNRGNGLSPDVLTWDAPFDFIRHTTDGGKTRNDTFDIDGDGMVDYVDFDSALGKVAVYHNAGGAWGPRLCSQTCNVSVNANGGKPDLLTTVETGTGGVNELLYRPANETPNMDKDGVPRMPFSPWVLREIERHDGLCEDPELCNREPLNTAMSYSHGLFEPQSREFRGFGTVQITDSALELKTLKFFHQDQHRKGKVSATEERDLLSGKLMRKVEDTYECIDNYASVDDGCPDYDGDINRWVRLKQSDTYDYDSNGVDRKHSWMMNETFDAWGNVTQSVRDSDRGPRVDSYVDYIISAGHEEWEHYVVDKPKHIVVKQNDLDVPNGGSVLEEKWFQYGNKPDRLEAVASWLYIDPAKAVPGAPQGDACIHDPVPAQGSCVTTRTTYDDWGNIESVIDANGLTKTTTYDDITRMYPYLEKTSPLAGGTEKPQVTASWFDVNCGKRTHRTTPYEEGDGVVADGQPVFVYKFDSFCRQWAYGEPVATSPSYTLALQIRGFYLGAPGHPTSIVTSEMAASDGWRNRVDLHDAFGRLLQTQTDAVVDDFLRTVASTTVTYDLAGRPKRQYVPTVVQSGSWGNDFWARDVAALPSNTGFRETTYDPLGRVTRVQQPDLTYVTSDYSLAWQTTTKDACYNAGTCLGSKTVEIRDANSRVVEKQVFNVDTFETRTEYVYDGAGRSIRTRQGKTLNSWTDDTIVQTDYDTLGRKVRMVDPDSGTWRYAYDRAGNLVYQDDPKGGNTGETAQSVQFTYDRFERVQRKRYVANDAYCTVGSSGCSESAYVAYEYDRTALSLECPASCPLPAAFCNLNRLTGVEDGSGTKTTTCHDVMGRQVESRKRLRADALEINASIETTYDSVGNVLQIKYPDGEYVSNRYNAVGNLIAVDSTQDGVERVYVYDIRYDEFGKPISVWHENGVTDWFEFHDKTKNFRLERIRIQKEEAQPILDFGYPDYQANGLLKEIVDPDSTARSNSARFSYDGLGRLTSVSNSLVNGTYAHSGNLGNMTSKDGTTLSYAEAAHPHRVTQASGGAAPYGEISYDGNGNQKAWPGRSYTYTRDDRLETVTAGSINVGLFYDESGARIAKRSQIGSGAPGYTWYLGDLMEVSPTHVTKYYFANGRRIASQRYLRQPGFLAAKERWIYVASAVLGGSPAVVLYVYKGKPWIFGFATIAVSALIALPLRRKRVVGITVRHGHVIAVLITFTLASFPVPLLVRPAYAGGTGGGTTDDTQGIRHYHYDHLGSVQLMTNESGQVYRQTRYTTYGRVRGTWGATGNAASNCGTTGYCIGFTGYDQEPLSQLLYARARFYDPALGMFLTHDPARQYPNPYAYGPWNPVNGTDPSGTIFGIDDGVFALIVVVVSSVAAGVDTAIRTGNAEAALLAFSTTFAIGIATLGIGYYGLGALQSVAPSFYASVIPALQVAGVAAGAYGTYQAASNGYYFSASVAAMLTAYSAYGLTNAAKGGNGISNKTRSAWATSQLESAQAREGSVAVSARRVGANNVEITYSDGSVELRTGGTVAWRNNNPGNLANTAFSARHGSIGAGANGMAVFPNPGVGEDALQGLLSGPTYQDLTLDAAIERFAPPVQNNTAAYQAQAARAVGVGGATQLGTLTGAQMNTLRGTIMSIEGWRPGTVAWR